jgi:hypothetical protein
MWNDILINIVGTIVGGLALAAVLFFFNEHVFSGKNLTGEWNVETTTEMTLYGKYMGMKLSHKFHLLHGGTELSGTGEKTKELLSDSTLTEYERKNRISSTIKGRYERKIFGSDKVYLNILEDGQQRKSRTTYLLTVRNKNLLHGKFVTTAADSTGQVNLTRQ